MRRQSTIATLIALAFAGTTACSGAGGSGDTDTGTTGGNDADMTDGRSEMPSYDGLIINEIVADGEPDWFELYNTSDDAIVLTDVTFTDDIAGEPGRAQFKDGDTIEAGGYLTKDVGDATVGFGLGGDEELGIIAPDGTVIASVDWDEGDSPESKSYGRFPNGTGDFQTLSTPTKGAKNTNEGPECGDGAIEGSEVCDGDELDGNGCSDVGFDGGDLACADNCLEFDTSGCTTDTGGVIINEVNPDNEKIELYNTGSSEASLQDFWITDDDDYADGQEMLKMDDYYVFTDETIPAGEYLVLGEETTGIGIGDDESITLLDADQMVVDQATTPTQINTESWCRIPDARADSEFELCERTFGQANEALKASIIVNEVNADNEKIELYNPTSSAVALSDYWITDDGDWDEGQMTLNMDDYYVFTDETVPAGGYLVLEESTTGIGVGGEEEIALLDPDGNPVDVAAETPKDIDKQSWCRIPNGEIDALFELCEVTFGAENVAQMN
jgi:hypothetical protein